MNKWDQLTHVRLGKQKKKENLFFFARSMYTITTTIWLNRFKSQLKVYLRNNESNTTTVKVVSPGNPTLVPCAYSNTSHQYSTNDVQTKKDMLFNVRWFLVKWKNICHAQTVPFWIWSSLIQYIYIKKNPLDHLCIWISIKLDSLIDTRHLNTPVLFFIKINALW